MPSRAVEHPLSNFDVFNLRFGIFGTAVGCLFFGVYCTLFIATILIFIVGRLSLSKAQMGLFVVTILMLSLSTTSLVLNITSNLPPSSLLQLDPPNRAHFNLIFAQSALERLNYLFSDGIVIWRAWILCPGNGLLKLAMCICMVFSCIGSFLDMGLSAKDYSQNPKNYGPRTRFILMMIPLLVTNLTATSIIVYKLIWHCRNTRNFTTDKTYIPAFKVRKFLMLLIHSGLVYAILLTVYMVLTLLNGKDSVTYQVLASAVPMISAIYPLFIIIVAAFQNQRLSPYQQQDYSEAEDTGTMGLVSGSVTQ